MSDIPEYDPKKDDMGAGEGARGGGDENPQDYNLPDKPKGAPDERRRLWKKEGARPKYPYERVPQHDKDDIPMSTKLPDEKKGLPSTSKGTAETSFIEGNPSEHVLTTAEKLGTMEVEQHFPNIDHSKVAVRYISQERGGLGDRFEVKMRNKTKWYPLFVQKKKKDENGEYVLRKNLTQETKKTLGPYKTKTELVQQLDQNIEEFSKIIEEDTKVAGDENEQPEVRDQARERITENTERRAQAVQERKQIAERLPLRERLKDLFKKHGFTIATVVTAVGITIGVIAKILADGASAAANGIKTVGKKVGDGLKELGKKIGSILPGLVGAIASFVFRAAGQAISFLAKNAWLLILAVVAFMIQKLTEKKRE